MRRPGHRSHTRWRRMLRVRGAKMKDWLVRHAERMEDQYVDTRSLDDDPERRELIADRRYSSGRQRR